MKIPILTVSLVIVLLFGGVRDAESAIPVIHSTDLAHPYWDPDDQFDLATLFSLPELSVKGIVLDNGYGVLQTTSPGTAPVQQMLHITGQNVPYATGLLGHFTGIDDTGQSQPAEFQSGVNLILAQLANAQDNSVVIQTVGSCRDLAAAYNRNPQLLGQKVKAIYVNAGTGPNEDQSTEYDAAIEPLAYLRLFQSGLPMYWLPCVVYSNPQSPYQTRYQAVESTVIDACAPAVKKYFQYCLSKSTADPIAFLSDTGPVPEYNAVKDMFCTAGMIAAAGRKTYQRGPGDFVALSPDEAQEAGLLDNEVDVFQFVPMAASVDSNLSLATSLHVTLNPTEPTNSYVFQITDARYGEVMASCLKNLLSGLDPVTTPEPGTIVLLATGLLTLLLACVRRKGKK